MRIGLVGNPNSGKTTLFNRLTGSRQRVGNWAGVTVDKKSGNFQLHGQQIEVIDLPGTYSLTGSSDEGSVDERIACHFILDEQVDAIVNIIDAANLERNLYLTTQLLEMNVPIIIALNMTDIARKRGIHINHDELSQQLGCPVVPMVLRRGKGIDLFKQALQQLNGRDGSQGSECCAAVKHGCRQQALPKYTPLLEQAMKAVTPLVKSANQRWYAIRLLEGDSDAQKLLINNDPLADKLRQWEKRLHEETTLDGETLFADARYRYIQRILQGVWAKERSLRSHFSDYVDRIVLNRWLGIPIFLFVMYLMFEFSITLGGALQPLFDNGSSTIFIDGINALGYHLHLPLWLTAIFAQGIGLGINTVVSFIPQIGLLFLFLSFIEDSGYMARAAFVMDRFMQFIGLPGKSFVPLIIGFGCNVPAIMAARTLDSRRDRLLTIMMSPFMSCGARMAIFAVFATAFFSKGGALVVFLLYLTGIAVAMLTGLILKLTLLKGEAAPFVLELPPYHMPSARILLRHTWMRLRRFVIRAGKVIVPICLLVGSLNAIDFNGNINPNGSQHSVLSQVGRVITPVFHPMGVSENNWPATVGLITGTLAKEVVVGTMNTLYSQNSTTADDTIKAAQTFNLWTGLKQSLSNTWESVTTISARSLANPFVANEADHNMSGSAMGKMAALFGGWVSAFAYMLFVLLYVPCVSAIAVTARESRSRGWTWLSVLWSFSIAYGAAVLFYQTATIMQHPWSSSGWIAAMLLYLGGFVVTLHYASRQPTMIIRHRPYYPKSRS
ncbi:MAG: Fe(2+) transporter permease subunit FeoB [Gammaproteobacteria bacterium]|nr:Fe(2+) transporter permease subunit FeoB [Gammaproteobacteria bacterium]